MGEFGQEFLWVTRIARNTVGVGFGGEALANRVVRWVLKGNRVYLREVHYDVVANLNTAISRAVQSANNETILAAFPVAAFNRNGDPVIEVTRLFSTHVPEFSARQRLSANAMDPTAPILSEYRPMPEILRRKSATRIPERLRRRQTARCLPCPRP